MSTEPRFPEVRRIDLHPDLIRITPPNLRPTIQIDHHELDDGACYSEEEARLLHARLGTALGVPDEVARLRALCAKAADEIDTLYDVVRLPYDKAAVESFVKQLRGDQGPPALAPPAAEEIP